MKRILGIAFLSLLFANCKENVNTDKDKNLVNNPSIELAKKSSNKTVEENKEEVSNSNDINADAWTFYKISENSISETQKETKDDLINKFKDVKIEIGEKNITVGKICTFEFYKSIKTPIRYYESAKTVKLYESIFLKNGLNLGNEIIIFQSLYPEKSCKIPWDELLIIDKSLVIVYDDYLVFFKKGNSSNQNDCFFNTKITNLPITTSVIDGNNVWNELDCNISDLKTRDYLRLPNIKDVKVFIIADFNFDDFRYTLLTLKNNKVITKKDVGFAKEGDKPNTVSEFTEFEVNKDYIFSLNTKNKKGDSFKTLKLEKFKIKDDGLIEIIK